MSRLIRTAHRWLGMALIALTVVNAITFAVGQPQPWLYYLPLIPLLLSMLSGLYMFVLPYIRRSKAA